MAETVKESGGGTATAPPPPAKPKKQSAPKTTPKKGPPRFLPQWKVLLHNDEHNSIEFVVVTIVELIHIDQLQAVQRTMEAHRMGVSLLLITHRERAELYKDQFTSKGLTVTIEPEKE